MRSGCCCYYSRSQAQSLVCRRIGPSWAEQAVWTGCPREQDSRRTTVTGPKRKTCLAAAARNAAHKVACESLFVCDLRFVICERAARKRLRPLTNAASGRAARQRTAGSVIAAQECATDSGRCIATLLRLQVTSSKPAGRPLCCCRCRCLLLAPSSALQCAGNGP